MKLTQSLFGILAIAASLLAGCSQGPPYAGDWHGSNGSKDSFASLTMKDNGTFIVSLSEPGDGLGGGNFHSGTYAVASSNANEIEFTIQVQSSIHEQNPTADAGLAGGTLKWSKDGTTGKETMAYSYQHKSGRSESFRLEKNN